eukprot:TRINITY_DN3137_c0_g1_i1.p1 TRINITY_DN3137_c0_g1~~TRINITY_DN3137_c0_g1_i1.p1  ORF type:complete len:238 (+),score=51.08 TRINITY_DN3137_c0_g1_i1:54-716(+)
MKAAVQCKAPGFNADALLPDGTFGKVSLDDYRGKYLVLFFYPLDFTFVCPTEITQFSDRAGEFRAAGCEVVGCSVDSKFSHLAWSKQGRKEGGLGPMQIPLLSDITKKISLDYGVLIKEGDAQGIALRGLFIIDPKQTIRHYTINDLPVGRNPDEVLRLVKAFKYSDEHGEVMPCNWRPGAKTMKPDPEASQEYFSTVDNNPLKRARSDGDVSAAPKRSK